MDGRSHCAELVRRDDADRYLTALFAPSDRRSDLLALYAFNAEVARSREVVSEPMLGHIRLQWWREAIAECYDDRPRRHQVVEPLAAAIRRHGLPRGLFDRLLDARAMDLSPDPPETLAQLVAYADATSGDLTRLALFVLGASDESEQSAGAGVGTAWALTGLMRALPHHLRQGRYVLPRDVMVRHGVAERALREVKSSTQIYGAVEEICGIALKKIKESRSQLADRTKRGLPAMLPATLAEAYLARFSRLGYDPFDARIARPLPMRAWRLMGRALLGRF
ncbi:MAG: squalene/phytoene synthase family protein [Rhodospirillales bacterium]|nr:MAG: squalene/phytoene synthase family protein [Rhodospirillales bacterium]